MGKDQFLGGISFHFLLLRDQATYKRRFEKIQGKKPNPNFPLYDFDFGEKPQLKKKGVLLIINHFWSCFRWIPWWVLKYDGFKEVY